MDPTLVINTILKVISLAIDAAPAIQKGIQDARPFAEAIYNSLIAGKEVTEEELSQLETMIDALSDQLQEPLPPE